MFHSIESFWHLTKRLTLAQHMAMAIVSLLLSAPAIADTIHVPQDFTTIQEAIDASQNGDIILVDQGTYVENINYHEKWITVQSVYGPDSTIIEGMYGPTVRFVEGEDL